MGTELNIEIWRELSWKNRICVFIIQRGISSYIDIRCVENSGSFEVDHSHISFGKCQISVFWEKST